MILLIEPNRVIRKRLCDMLHKERIISVGTVPEILEMIVKFKNNFNLLIANLRILDNIVSSGTLFRLCERLYIEIPPLLAIYRKGDERVKEKFENKHPNYKFIEYARDDNGFPDRYVHAVQDLFPNANIDIHKANEIWLKGEDYEMHVDPHNWLVDEGFIEAIESSRIGKLARDMEEILPMIRKLLAAEKIIEEQKINENDTSTDYQGMYHDLKKKYDRLVSYVSELITFIKKT
jgi:hypothetical protein